MPTSANPNRLRKPREFFYNDKAGHRISDDKLHDALIADGDEARARAVSERVARRLGLTNEEIAALRPKR